MIRILFLTAAAALIACGPDAPDGDDAATALDTTAMAAMIRAVWRQARLHAGQAVKP